MKDRWTVLKSDEEILKYNCDFPVKAIPNDRTIRLCNCGEENNHWHDMWAGFSFIPKEMILCEVPRVGEFAEFSDDNKTWWKGQYSGYRAIDNVFTLQDNEGIYCEYLRIRMLPTKHKITIEVDETQIEQIKAMGVNVNG